MSDDKYIIDFNDYNQMLEEKNDNIDFIKINDNLKEKLLSIGTTNVWIKDIKNIYSYKNKIRINLLDAFYQLIQNYNNNIKCYFKFGQSNKLWEILNIIPCYENTQLVSLEFNIINQQNSNFHDWLKDLPINNDNDIQDIFNSIKIQTFNISLIVDCVNQIIYSKFIQTYPVVINNSSLLLNKDNSIQLNISNKENNILSLIEWPNKNNGIYVEK